MNERIFQCTGQEEIEELLEFVKTTSADTIFLQFPRNSILFQQKTNLLKLHTLADEQKKNIILVTQNARARKEMQSIGISVLAAISDRETKSIMELNKPTLPHLHKISQHPIDPERFRNKHSEEAISAEIVQKISKPSLHALFLLGVLALAFFAFIVFITVPNASITVTPERREVEMHLNTELLSKEVYSEEDLWKKNNGIFMIPVDTEFEYKGIYTDVHKQVEGENAKGMVEIINKSKNPIKLVSGTRLQTQEGILFLLPYWVQINPGESKKIRVEAATEDVYRKVQADRANIPKNTLMILPGLSLSMQKEVYAVSVEDFSGGRGTWKYFVTKENLEEAKKEWEEEARKQISEKISEKISAMQSGISNDELRLITPYDDYVSVQVKGYSFGQPEDQLIGSAIPSFSGSIRIKVRVYAYSLSSMKEIIAAKFERLAPDGMKLSSINTNILVLQIRIVNPEKNLIKAAVSTRGIYEYVVEPRSDKSEAFIAAAKQAIVGKSAEEAKTILLNNFKEVSDVSISLFPFWNTHIPSLPEKISFTIAGSDE